MRIKNPHCLISAENVFRDLQSRKKDFEGTFQSLVRWGNHWTNHIHLITFAPGIDDVENLLDESCNQSHS